MGDHGSEYIVITCPCCLNPYRLYIYIYIIVITMDVDVDNILTTLGPWKRYQIFQLIYTGLIHMFGTAYVVLLYVFIGMAKITASNRVNFR